MGAGKKAVTKGEQAMADAEVAPPGPTNGPDTPELYSRVLELLAMPFSDKLISRRRSRLATAISQATGKDVRPAHLVDAPAALALLATNDGVAWVVQAAVAAVNLGDSVVDLQPVRVAVEEAQRGLTPEQCARLTAVRKSSPSNRPPGQLPPLRKGKSRSGKPQLTPEQKAINALRASEELVRAARRAQERRAEELRILAVHREEFIAMATVKVRAPDFCLADLDELATKHLALFGQQLTVDKAVKKLGLADTLAATLAAQHDAREAERLAQKLAAKAAALARQSWERSLVPSFELPAALKITKTEYQRWLEDGKLKPVMKRPFKKWGQHLELPLFDPAHLAKVTPAVLQQWREAHKALTASNRRAGAKKGQEKAVKTRSIKQALKLHEYHLDFDIARAAPRDVKLCLGPTNSGKTHRAMQALMQAPSGLYLAPLRLLALEGYERLKAAGIPVNLMTGEEQVYDPAAKHTCATVEMCDFATAVDVAVIDEVQLLGDEQRGWAWTAALLGAPAKTVYACGARWAGAAVQALLAQTSDTLEEIAFERMNPLRVMDATVSLNNIKPGDALVAFSRREVLQFAFLLRKRNLKVSVIYGALSPEVRRAQVQAFAEGRTQVVVATDAIGMGVNLPIRRVIFTETRKYDGTAMRYLKPAEVQQIAGRAGRFGLHDEGWVGAFSAGDLSHITRSLAQPVPELEGPFRVMPTWEHVRHALKTLGASEVSEALEFFERISFGGKYRKAELGPALDKARFSQGIGLSPRAVFRLACAPADLDNHNDRWVLEAAIDALQETSTLALPPCPVPLEGGKVTAHALEQAEGYSRRLALFAWLGCAFSGLVDLEGLPEHRQRLTEFINRALEAQTGEMVKKQKRRYGWSREDVDFNLDDDEDED